MEVIRVLYIFRNPYKGYSITKVFTPIANEMKRHCVVESIVLPSTRAMPIDLLRDAWFVLKCIKRNNSNLVHITGDSFFLASLLHLYCKFKRIKIVSTVHDLGNYTNSKRSIKRLLYYLIWVKSIKYSDWITFVSGKSKNEADKILHLKKNYSIINNPVDPSFKYVEHTPNLIIPTILHLGTKFNKNLERSIVALSEIKCNLRIIGKLTDNQLKLLDKYKINYSNSFDLKDDEILKEYENCDIVNFPSLYEGFGMPVIEGQAVGRPVLASNIDPVEEISGNASVLVDPYDVTSIIKGYDKIIDSYSYYVNLGLENVKRFKADKIALDYYNLYKFLINNE